MIVREEKKELKDENQRERENWKIITKREKERNIRTKRKRERDWEMSPLTSSNLKLASFLSKRRFWSLQIFFDSHNLLWIVKKHLMHLVAFNSTNICPSISEWVGREPWSSGRGWRLMFKSQHWILDGIFFTLICCKIRIGCL